MVEPEFMGHINSEVPTCQVFPRLRVIVGSVLSGHLSACLFGRAVSPKKYQNLRQNICYFKVFVTICWVKQVCMQLFIMPPGTVVPMGAYCFYCVRMYVCTYVRTYVCPRSVKVFG